MKKLLFTCRHPGPLDSLVKLIERLRARYTVYLLVTDSALESLISRHRALLGTWANVRMVLPAERAPAASFVDSTLGEWIVLSAESALHVAPAAPAHDSWTQLADEQFSAIDRLVESLARLFRRLRPDIVVRSAPAEDIGVDEIAATARMRADPAFRLLCFLDEPGVGRAIGPNRHPRLSNAIDGCIVHDAECAALAEQELGMSAGIASIAARAPAGGGDWRAARAGLRQRLGIGEEERVVLIALNYSRYYQPEWRREVEAILRACAELAADHAVRFALRPHPRTPADVRALLDKLKAPLGLSWAAGLERGWTEKLVLVPDVIVSHASDMNIEMLEHLAADRRATEPANDRVPVSVYVVDDYVQKLVNYLAWLPTLPRHMTGHGSLITPVAGALTALERALFEPELGTRLLAEYSAGRAAAAGDRAAESAELDLILQGNEHDRSVLD